jgi:hypothetical protein
MLVANGQAGHKSGYQASPLEFCRMRLGDYLSPQRTTNSQPMSVERIAGRNYRPTSCLQRIGTNGRKGVVERTRCRGRVSVVRWRARA